ncbi:uncharacterized protein LOC129961001 [Argiope bruennichi]|uniref:uncharacterized protein LOC129961001 n=1 Tax=Argiope bruennichi TaxID=94029 RepID=UPI00249578AD|nr:uncharacterized protein LOC129961001 [Argiope bruennichi]
MEASVDDPKIIIPFVPSLSHFSAVKVALPLFNNFDKGAWHDILEEMKNVNPARLNEAKAEKCEVNKAKERLLLIPADLRLKVLEAIVGLDSASVKWDLDHSFLLISKNIDDSFYWKTDGTIDRIKTVQQLLLNDDIIIEQKFDLACSYFLEKSIQTLWSEMESSGKTEKPLAAYNPISRFWVRRMSHKYQTPWIKSVKKYLELPEKFSRIPIPRFSAFFPLLQPEDRKKFLVSLCNATSDDFLFCMYGITKQEEVEMLKTVTPKLLFLYLAWPLQSFFLAMAERLWNFIDYPLFQEVLDTIYSYNVTKIDFDYVKLFLDFYERSPNHLKEKAKTCLSLINRIQFCKDAMRKRKKDETDELTNSKKQRNELYSNWLALDEEETDSFPSMFFDIF